jgi:hypothetical protein
MRMELNKRKYFINLKMLCLVARMQKPAGPNSLGVERSLTSPGGPEGGAKKPAGANSLGVGRSLSRPEDPEREEQRSRQWPTL